MKRNADAEVFCETVKRHRKARGLTQEELAELAELNVSYIGFVERGEKVPTLTVVLNLAEALQVEPGELRRDTARQRRR